MDEILKRAEQWERAAINHAYRISDTSYVSGRMPVSEMFRIAKALCTQAQSGIDNG